MNYKSKKNVLDVSVLVAAVRTVGEEGGGGVRGKLDGS